jgi:hypothetical protein
MIANENTPLRTLGSQVSKARLDALLAYATALKRGLNRDGTKGKPTVQRRGSDLGERDVADKLLADHGHERRGERIGPAQRLDDLRFGSVAERKAGKRACGERANAVVVGSRLRANQNGQAFPAAQASSLG